MHVVSISVPLNKSFEEYTQVLKQPSAAAAAATTDTATDDTWPVRVKAMATVTSVVSFTGEVSMAEPTINKTYRVLYDGHMTTCEDEKSAWQVIKKTIEKAKQGGPTTYRVTVPDQVMSTTVQDFPPPVAASMADSWHVTWPISSIDGTHTNPRARAFLSPPTVPIRRPEKEPDQRLHDKTRRILHDEVRVPKEQQTPTNDSIEEYTSSDDSEFGPLCKCSYIYS